MSTPSTREAIRLTSFAHGGGCGCKLAPAVLADLLTASPATAAFSDLLVGTDTSDDAAVYRLNAEQALVATTDFFMPIVDDPHDFGRIAATNALSDVYAMGGRPILALAILGMPIDKLPIRAVQQILAGGADVCRAANVPIAGGHSIDNPEPIYGLVALGLVHPNRVLRNSGAKAGDRLVLTKALGVGIYGAALKRGALDADLYRAMIATTTQLNTVGAELGGMPGVHAVTDVTGFGLLGHALELCRGSGLAATVELERLPLLPEVERLAADGFGTGGAQRNWSSYGEYVRLPAAVPDWRRGLLCDPQTSGGLLIAVDAAHAESLVAHCRASGFAATAEIGELGAGEPGIRIV
jgi:selenide,water dikinase